MKLKYYKESWEHQQKALEYLYPRDSGALYTDPATGKTKVMIDLILNRGFEQTYIVCTDKACKVWENEVRKWSPKGRINVINLRKVPAKKRASTIQKKRAEGKSGALEVIITSYGSIWRKPFADWLKKNPPDCVICDESHKIKAPASKCSHYLFELGKRVPYRYLMTGTPLAQNPIDIYAQYKFLDPSIFGTNFKNFKDRYENLDKFKTKQFGYRVLDKKQPYINLKELHNKMFSCAFRVKSSLKLPPKRFIKVGYELPASVMKIYSQLRKERAIILGDKYAESTNALSLVNDLQMLTGGYLKLVDEEDNKTITKVDDTRQRILYDMLDEFDPREPVVVFVRYKRNIKDVHEVVKSLGRKSSEISGDKDEQEEWDAGKTDVIVVQIQSGAESIDLTRARYCIYYNLTHSLGTFQQSVKRIHRPKQKRKTVYYIITAIGTIDELMYSALKNKKDLIKEVMSGRIKI